MKSLSVFLILFVISMAGCQKRPAAAVADEHWKPEIEWNAAQYSIEDYKRMQPHRPILAVFSSKWLPSRDIALKEKKFMDILREGQFLCLNYESSALDSIGQVELKKLGHQSDSIIFVSIPNLGDRQYPFTYDEVELLALVNQISKEAEQAPSDGDKSQLNPPEFWKPLERKLGDYVAEHPGRPIILSVSAKWSAISTRAWRVLFSDEVTAALQPSGFLCLVGDVTEGDKLAKGEMEALGRVAVPVTAIYDPVDKAWHVQDEMFSAADVDKWILTLQNKIAEHAGRGDGDKPSN